MSITSIQDLFEKQKILGPVSFNDKTNLLRNLSSGPNSNPLRKTIP